MKKKCKREGCYEPADCWHGFCAKHCHASTHREREYNRRTYPKGNEPHLGVEIEVEYSNDTDKKRGISFTAAHHDGSLQCGAEYKILAPTKRCWRKCEVVLEKLWERRAKVTNRCGLHVHIDTRNVSHDRLQKAWAWLHLTQEVWFGLMPHSRRDNNYCHKVAGMVTSDHYAWVHTTRYSTLEIRLHGGTLNPFKVRAWLACMAHLQAKMMDPTYEFPTVTPEQDATACFWAFWADAPKEAREYLSTRKLNNGVINDYAYQQVEAGPVA